MAKVSKPGCFYSSYSQCTLTSADSMQSNLQYTVDSMLFHSLSVADIVHLFNHPPSTSESTLFEPKSTSQIYLIHYL